MTANCTCLLCPIAISHTILVDRTRVKFTDIAEIESESHGELFQVDTSDGNWFWEKTLDKGWAGVVIHFSGQIIGGIPFFIVC